MTSPQRLALGVAYVGQRFHGWQSQPGGQTVQDHLEGALSRFADVPVTTVCAGRTDTGVHALQQVVHLDPPVQRDLSSWVRGTNRFLPVDIAVQWCCEVPAGFHANCRWPMGLQLIGRPRDEAGLLRLAAGWENAGLGMAYRTPFTA